jgi:hypothetical protein
MLGGTIVAGRNGSAVSFASGGPLWAQLPMLAPLARCMIVKLCVQVCGSNRTCVVPPNPISDRASNYPQFVDGYDIRDLIERAEI